MARTNKKKKRKPVFTHQGAIAENPTALKELQRTLSTCMLFEDTYYEKGSLIAKRLAKLANEVKFESLAREVRRAKNDMHLRHAPLWVAVNALKCHKGAQVGDLIYDMVRRADELAESLAMYWRKSAKKDKLVKAPLANQLKLALARAFHKFDEYQFAKYNRDGQVKLRDVMFLVHPKPKDKEQERLFKAIAENTLETPDTWEVALSSGKDKRATWERLIRTRKIGDLAFLRNLRNMHQVGVNDGLIYGELKSRQFKRILPHQFLGSARYAPWYEDDINDAMFRVVSNQAKLPGETLIIVDVSGSMDTNVSNKSQLTRQDAADILASVIRERSERATVYATGGNDRLNQHKTVLIPSRHGMALADAILHSRSKTGQGGIFIVQVMEHINRIESGKRYDRVICLTDEQDCEQDRNKSANKAVLIGKRNYILNLAPYKYGEVVGKVWTRINGFSFALVDWILEEENNPVWNQ